MLKNLPDIIEQFAAKKAERLAADKVAQALKHEEVELQNEICKLLKDSGLTGAGGATHKVTLKTIDKPVAQDWDEIYTYIKEEDAFDLLQRRLTEGAVKARWEEDIDIPGIATYPVDKLTLSKVS